MHLCFVALSYPVDGGPSSGVSTQVRVLAEAMIELGHSVSIVALGSSETLRTENKGIRICSVTSGKLHWYISKLPLVGKALALPIRELEYSLAAWRGVRKINKVEKLDLIEGTETGMLAVSSLIKFAPVIIRLHGEQYTFHQHTPNMRLTVAVRLSRIVQRLALRRAEMLVSPSHAHATTITEECGSTLSPIRVIPNSVKLSETKSWAKREENLVLFVGRFERVKGIALFLEAAGLIRQQYPRARFVVAGTEHASVPQQEIERLLKQHSLEPHVEHLGFLSRDELIDLYHRASICVVPSFYESFGLVALEAMACGLPVVASRVGGLTEVVDDGVTGRLVNSANPEALASSVVELLRDPAQRAALSEAAQQRAGQFSIERNAGMNLSAYFEVIAAARKREPASVMTQSESQIL
jgi:glycosyltransferase involved in cell wall biosynthesis